MASMNTSFMYFLLIFGILIGSLFGVASFYSANKRGKYYHLYRYVKELGYKFRYKEAQRLNPGIDYVGITLGNVPRKSRKKIIMGLEDTRLVIASPRRGKTTRIVKPTINNAPGNVIVTSNKPDILYDLPEECNIFVFDPQSISDKNNVIFNILGYINSFNDAEELAIIFDKATTENTAYSDKFFAPYGRSLLACCLYTAAKSNKELSDVYQWLTNPKQIEDPLKLLNKSKEAADKLIASTLEGIMNMPAETRGGVYGNAKLIANPLANYDILRYTNDEKLGVLFDIDKFVHSTERNILCLLSKEGVGTASVLTTMLTIWIAKYAENYANSCDNGRLAIPMVFELDEAANICRWHNLPELYSHYGSKGIILSTYLQSYSQGVKVWGEQGMRTLWNASTIKMYAGGNMDAQWLREVEALCGDHVEFEKNYTSGKYANTTRNRREKKNIKVSELSSLPLGKALILNAYRPIIVELPKI